MISCKVFYDYTLAEVKDNIPIKSEITTWLPSGMVHRAKIYGISSTSSCTLDYKEKNSYGTCDQEKGKLLTITWKSTLQFHYKI